MKLKKRLWHRCFPMNFAKFLRAPFFTEHLWTTASVNFHVTGLFLYPLKTSENQRFSCVFRRYTKKSVAWNGWRNISHWRCIIRAELGNSDSRDIVLKNIRRSMSRLFWDFFTFFIVFLFYLVFNLVVRSM